MMQALQRWMYCLFLVATCMRSSNYRAQKGAIHMIGTSRFSFSLAQWASYQASCLPTLSLKEQTKTWPELDMENLRGTCPKGKLEFRQVFFEPWNDQTLHVQFFLEKLIVQNSLEGLGIIVRCLKQRRNEPLSKWREVPCLLQLGLSHFITFDNC